MKKFNPLLTLLLLLLFSAKTVQSWGVLTHIYAALKAGENNLLPVARPYLGAFLAGVTEPDFGALSGEMAVSADYHFYHDPVLVKAMQNIAEKKKSPAHPRG